MQDDPRHTRFVVALKDALNEVLGPEELAEIDLNDVDLDTPILALALDSLTLMMVAEEVKDRLGVWLPVERLYSAATVRDMAEAVADDGENGSPAPGRETAVQRAAQDGSR